jgi:alpha-N-arabinofuranosidase
MKKLTIKKLLIILIFAFSFSLSAQTTQIKVDIDRTVGEIDPKIYGVFMEPIHFSGRRLGLPDTAHFNTLYGNLYDPFSPLANENGFRKDYIEAMKELKITNMRWPGGNFVMGYNWQDGIGPKDRRPVRINLAWGGTDNNHVGTDEWIALNKAMGSENIICVNLGLAPIQDACYWVEYCNSKKGTYYSDLRAKNGHQEPYKIKIWDLGNEVDGEPWELGYKNADDYVKIAREAAKAMKAVDKTISLVASGSSYYESTGLWIEWNRKILAGLGDKIDYISIHRYWERSDDYYTYMGQSAMDFEEKIKITAAEIVAVKVMKGFKNPIFISFDEWGTFGRNFKSVLPIAQCLNSFLRHADIIKMTNFTLMTSLLQTDQEKGSFKTPLFHTFKLFSNNCHGRSVDVFVKGNTFDTEAFKGIPYLDVTSAFNDDTGTLVINVINRHKDESIKTEILNSSGRFSGKAIASIMNQDLDEAFYFDKRDQYIPETKVFSVKEKNFTYSFPPHSFVQIRIQVEK